jgi:hypothetical protein
VKTPNDPTTIASARETLAGVDEPTTTVHTLSAWILAKDYERIRAERDELRAALQGLLTLTERDDEADTPGTDLFTAATVARAVLAKGETP